MSQLECPSFQLRISALGAPKNCPRWLIREKGRVELVIAPTLDSPPPSTNGAEDAQAMPAEKRS